MPHLSYVKRFIKNCRTEGNKLVGTLAAHEIKGTQQDLIKLIQQECFAEECELLKTKQEIRSAKLKDLSPLMDEDELIRVGGRLKHANIPYDWKHRVILSKHHHISELIAREYHNHSHLGTEYLPANLRKKYWIIGGRILVKQIIKKCIICQKKRAKNLNPKMSDLPLQRLEAMKPPFCRTGIDLFGLICVKQRRATLKHWGVLFTCFTTCAIHLDVVEGFGIDSFISSLKRFMNRRGRADEICSDCGTNFKGTVQELKIEGKKVKEFSADKGTTWNFNPPVSPHMGGVWKRGIKTAKDVLYSMIKSTVLTEFQLCTIFTEIEVIVSSRPLTHVSDSPDDFEALTPNHFLLGRFNTTGELCQDADGDKSSQKQWKQVVAITKQFWKRWL